VPELAHDGLPFPEGPTFDSEGTLFICTRKSGRVVAIRADGSRSSFLELEGQPNGTALGPDGSLFVTDARAGRVIAVDRDANWEVVVREYEGEPLLGPNDLVFDAFGVLYFTDPGRDLSGQHGAVYRVDQARQVDRIAAGLGYPNGIAVSPDGTNVLVAETAPRRIIRLSRLADGRFGVPELFATTSGGIGPDGMAWGPNGRLYVANHGAGTVDVFDPGGACVERLPAGGPKPTNCTFFGGSLYVTEDETASVWRLEVEAAPSAVTRRCPSTL
jgi:gluconolactonase